MIADYCINATPDVVRGDEILFRSKGKIVEGRVVDDAYQPRHVFVVRLSTGEGIRVKARELYHTNPRRKPWPDEVHRRAVQQEKFRRAEKAKARINNRLFGKVKREMDAFFAPRNQFQTT